MLVPWLYSGLINVTWTLAVFLKNWFPLTCLSFSSNSVFNLFHAPFQLALTKFKEGNLCVFNRFTSVCLSVCWPVSVVLRPSFWRQMVDRRRFRGSFLPISASSRFSFVQTVDASKLTSRFVRNAVESYGLHMPKFRKILVDKNWKLCCIHYSFVLTFVIAAEIRRKVFLNVLHCACWFNMLGQVKRQKNLKMQSTFKVKPEAVIIDGNWLFSWKAVESCAVINLNTGQHL